MLQCTAIIRMLGDILPPPCMDTPLTRALDDLRAHGAVGIPAVTAIESAQNGTRWSGLMTNEKDVWQLVKNRAGSYNATF